MAEDKIICNYDKLKGKIREVFKTNANYAKFLGISEASLYQKFQSDSYFNQSQIIKTLEAFSEDSTKSREYFFTYEIEKNSTE